MKAIVGLSLALVTGLLGIVAFSRARFVKSNPSPAVAEQTTSRSAPLSTEIRVEGDWPNLFGPGNDSFSGDTGVLTRWSEDGPQERWRREIGCGYSSPVASNIRVVVMHRRAAHEYIECFDINNGETIWEFKYDTTFNCKYEYSNGPYSTPVLSHDRVFTIGAQGQLHCLDLATGELIWRRMLHEEYEVDEPLFGVGASPLIERDMLIFNLGARDANAGIVALSMATGETRWSATQQGASYATPRAATIHGRRFVFVVTFEGLVALNPDQGEEYWSVPFQRRAVDAVNATSPLVHEDIVLIVTGPGPGALCLRVLPDGSYEKLWRDRRVLDSQFNTLFCASDHVFGYSSKQQGGASFRCVELATGKLKWKHHSDLLRGSGLLVNDHFILWGEEGHLASLKLNTERSVEVCITAEPLLAKPCYAAPALHRRALVVRNETTLLCLDLSDPTE